MNLAALFSRQTWVVVAPSLTVANFTRATQGGQLVYPTGTVLLRQARLLNRTISRHPFGGVSEVNVTIPLIAHARALDACHLLEHLGLLGAVGADSNVVVCSHFAH